MATVLDREQLTVKVYDGAVDPDWCPGCGDFGVLNALKKALLELELLPHEILVVSCIGCSSNLAGYIHSSGVHSLPVRSIPATTGLKVTTMPSGFAKTAAISTHSATAEIASRQNSTRPLGPQNARSSLSQKNATSLGC